MKNNKILKTIILTSFAWILISGTIGVVAIEMIAKEIKFEPTNSEWQVDNVEDAINDLYDSSLNSLNFNSMVLLWQNSDPTTAFASQTINLDLEAYDTILLVSRTTYGKVLAYNILRTDPNNTNSEFPSSVDIGDGGSNPTSFAVRHVSINKTSVIFSTSIGYNGNTQSKGTINGAAIPYYIYGFKK